MISILPVFLVIQLLCFQTDVADALRVRPVDKNDPQACSSYTAGDKEMYRCCSGFYANDSRCIVCPKGTYGYGCEETCKCQSYERCYHVHGCVCPVGKWGDQCQNKCQCYARVTCDRYTGKCTCEPGWIGDACTDCDKTKVNRVNNIRYCIDKCLHCFNGPYCNINVPENCHCTSGWTGNSCNDSTHVKCYTDHDKYMCDNHRDCDDFHLCNVNTCKCDWCAPGYKGKQCNLPCEYGKYGYDCNYPCYDVCGFEKCHHITGNCTICPNGYHGENCDKKCPTDYYGYNCQEKCQCSEKMICDHQVGCTCGDECTTSMQYSTSTSQKSDVTTLGQSDTDSASTAQQSEVTIRRQSDTVSALITQQHEMTMRGQPEQHDPVTNGPHSTTKQIQDSENRINGDLDEIVEDNLPLIIGVCVFLVVLVIVIVIICIVCCRRRKRTENKRNAHYENVDVAAERTDNLAMFVSTNDYEMADVGTPGNTILINDRHPTNFQHGDDGSNGDEENRNRGIPEYAQVDKTRKKQKMAVVRPHYSEVAVNGETSTAESRNAPREAVHYYTLEEVDDKQTNFTGARALSGGPHSEEGVSRSDGRAHGEVDCQSQNVPRDDVHYYTLEEVDNKQTNFTGARVSSGRPNSEEGVSGSDGGAHGEVDCQSTNAPREDVHYYTLEEVDDKQTNYTGARVLSGGPHSEEGGSGSDGGAHEEEDYNVVDRTGKSYKIPLDGNEPVNYERLGMGKEDVPTYEDTDYNKLNFGPKQFDSNQESDYSSYQH